jgi:hypothetical protein
MSMCPLETCRPRSNGAVIARNGTLSISPDDHAKQNLLPFSGFAHNDNPCHELVFVTRIRPLVGALLPSNLLPFHDLNRFLPFPLIDR